MSYPYRTIYTVMLMCFLTAIPAHANKSGVGPTVLSLPQGPGSIGGVGENVQANLNMGLMSYPITIIVPQGRGQATPAMSIRYSSSAGAGLMGIGWDLNAGGSISRLTVRGLPEYQKNDRFYADSELVNIPGSAFYRARFEGGFARYRWVQKDDKDQRGYWIVEYPNGSKAYYGATASGELDLDSQVYGLQGTFRWELRTLVDRNGNRVEYSYFKDGPQAYLDTISWVFAKDNKPLYQVRFQYEKRPDPISDGKPGFDLQTLQRIKGLEITSAGQRFRSYSFAYEDSTGLSRLVKVTRYGRDPQKAYPVAFSMKYSNATFSKETSRLVTMPTALGVNFANGKADFLDINGDGLPDVIDTSKSNHVFHINTLTLDQDMQQKAHDFPASAKVTNPDATSGAELSNASVQMIDYNGDGFTDMVDAVNKAIYINKGNGRWESNSGPLQSFPVDGKDANMRFFDYNGDKAIDVISANGTTTTYWVSDGKGEWKQVDGKPNLGVAVARDQIRFIDINGDGLNDAVQILPKNMRYKKYLGYGQWSDWIDVKVPQLDKYELNTKAQFSDINGDGMADMVAFLGTSIVYFVNKNGREFAEPVTIQDFGGQAIPNSTQNSVRIADINGNGSRDIVWIDNNGKITYLELFSERPNLMREISNGIGQRINIKYSSSVYFYLRDKACDTAKDQACRGPWQNKMPMAFMVVQTIETWASRSDKPQDQKEPKEEERPQIQSIYYHDGFYDGIEKTFRGFRHVETLYDGDASQAARKDEIVYNVGDQDAYFHGKLLRRAFTDNQGKVYQVESLTWKDCGTPAGAEPKLAPPVRFICLQAKEREVIEGTPDNKRTLREEYEYDGFGNRTLVAELGEKDKQGDEKYTKNTYIAPQKPKQVDAKWLLRFPQKREYCEQKSGPCAATEYFYDGPEYQGLPAGEIEKGNLSRAQIRVAADGDTTFTPTRQKFDEYGNLVGIKSPSGALLRTVTWDDVYHRFAIKEKIQIKGQTLEFATIWDYALSAVTQSTDANGQVSRYTYDEFGRLTTVYQPGDPENKPSVQYRYQLQAPLSKIVTETRSQQGGELDRKVIQCFDGLGRKLFVGRMVEPGRFMIRQHTEYNREGLQARTWYTYLSDDRCRFTAPQQTPTSYFYDGLGRLIKVVYPDGSMKRTVYQPLVQVEYDEEDNRQDSPHYDTPKTTKVDGLGREVEVIEMPEKGKEITTKYRYTLLNADGRSLIARITFADGSQKQQMYNYLGQVVKVIDPDRQEFTYTYNQDNKLASYTDARGIKVMYTYDGLERMLTQEQDGKPETRITYHYDKPLPEMPQADFLKGQLSAIQYPGGIYLYSYDSKGNTVLTRHIFAGVAFDFKNTYNNVNQRSDATFPNGQKQIYQRDGAGRLLRVSEQVKDIKYTEWGDIQSWTTGGGVITSRSYDKRRRLVKIDVGGGKVFTLDYSIDANGNPTSIKQRHGEQSFTNTYTYDALYRLTKASLVDNQEVLTYAQNNLHNITSKTSSLEQKSPVHVGDYSYDKTRIHAVAQAGQVKLKYDPAGHLIQRDAMAITWDYMSRFQEASIDGKVAQKAWYDHSHRRIIKWEQGLHTFYIDDQYEIRNGAVVSYTQASNNRIVASWSVKGVAQFFDDLAPAEGDKTLKAKPDGAITAADVWLYHAAREKLLNIEVKKRPYDLDLTHDMLASSVQRLLLGDKEVNLYYHINHVGHVQAVTDGSGTVLQRKHYYPYGKIRAITGDKQLFSHGFQGTELDPVTQSNTFLKRAIDTQLGRWLSPDPLYATAAITDGEFNSYGAVRNNPIRNRDLEGTSTFAGEAGRSLEENVVNNNDDSNQSKASSSASTNIWIISAVSAVAVVATAVGVGLYVKFRMNRPRQRQRTVVQATAQISQTQRRLRKAAPKTGGTSPSQQNQASQGLAQLFNSSGTNNTSTPQATTPVTSSTATVTKQASTKTLPKQNSTSKLQKQGSQSKILRRSSSRSLSRRYSKSTKL